MLIGSVSNNINSPKYSPPSFKGNPIKFYSCRLNLAEDIVEFVEENRHLCNELADGMPAEQIQALSSLYREHLEENYRIFFEHLKPSCREIVKKLTELPTYDKFVIPFTTDLKPSELQHLYELASKRDVSGEMRIPGVTFNYFSQIPEERLKMLEPLMLSKNDMGLWNYSPSFILQLDKNFSDYQINVMSQLADCHVNGMNLRQIAENPYINHEKTIDKARGLKQLFGDKLREIEFYSNRNGENFLSVDIQLPHTDDKPDYLNFRRMFSLLDNDVNPKAKKTEMTETDSYINKIYADFTKKMLVFSAEDLEKSIQNVKKAVPEAEEHEILRTMQKLTQFADFNSLQNIAKCINHELHPSGGINPYFYYFSKKKYIFDLPKSDDGIKSSFVTKDDIHSRDFNKLLKRAQGSDIEWINLEGWSDGVNLFTDNDSLTEKTIKILKRAKKLQAKNEDYTFNDALSLVLNKEIISVMKKYGYKVKTITSDTPATRDVILNQLRPAIPTQSLLKSTVKAISSHYTNSTTSKKFKKLCMRIAKYYQENLQVYSKQRMIDSLKELNEIIYRQARINGVSSENVYYVLPNVLESEYKSFELITKMYCNLFGISKDNIIKINTFKDINNYPNNSVFVVLDDIVGSGDSMTKFGDYKHCAKLTDKNKHIFFCPIAAAKKGINYINSEIKYLGREQNDMTLYIYRNLSQKSNIATEFIISDLTPKLNTEVLGCTGHGNASLCQVFPYMGPDNDSVLASYIIKFFVPDDRCIKNKSKLLPVIEENTYYYDIFGTDKEHILTDGKRVYTPNPPNKLVLFCKKISDFIYTKI
ncbi:hypothetical protein J6P92_09680 [bacterium]|nr:hypothetical protein [bacterium]